MITNISKTNNKKRQGVKQGDGATSFLSPQYQTSYKKHIKNENIFYVQRKGNGGGGGEGGRQRGDDLLITTLDGGHETWYLEATRLPKYAYHVWFELP